MPTPLPSDGVRAERPAERALFHRLFDDAAVFPPGLAPLPRAITDHVTRQSNSCADLVGPLLLAASAIEEFLRLERPHQMEVALIGRPGTDLGLVGDAASRLTGDAGVSLAGAEIGWSPEWHQALGWGVRLSLEVPRGGNEQKRALADVQKHAHAPYQVQAKFRTGSTPDSPVPTPSELATFIRACVDHDLGFKLTGGLHHAISHTTAEGEGEDQFGFLNVIAATRWALAHGAEVPEMKSLLSQRDPVPIVDIITRMSQADASVVRAFFTAYGCCEVMDPIGDLAALGLIKETTV